MKYIKTYEQSKLSTLNIHLYDIENELKIYLDFNNGEPILKSEFNIDYVNFCKEIFLNKFIAVKSMDRTKNDPLIYGKVNNIGLFFYQDGYFLKIKIENIWHLIQNNVILTIYDVDNFEIENKPLHKKLKIQKKANKYNL